MWRAARAGRKCGAPRGARPARRPSRGFRRNSRFRTFPSSMARVMFALDARKGQEGGRAGPDTGLLSRTKDRRQGGRADRHRRQGHLSRRVETGRRPARPRDAQHRRRQRCIRPLALRVAQGGRPRCRRQHPHRRGRGQGPAFGAQGWRLRAERWRNGRPAPFTPAACFEQFHPLTLAGESHETRGATGATCATGEVGWDGEWRG